MTAFWKELRRRNVFRVGIAYLAVIWVLIQVADIVLPVVNAPPWLLQALVFSSVLGFPLALVLAWFYELTPEGIKAASDLEVTETLKFTGRKLDFAIIGLLVLAVGFLVVDDFVLTVERDRSIAVLPFTNLSVAEENAEFFSTGMHDALLTQLAKLGDIKVISRTSVLEYQDSPKNMRQIGEELGVATILEGSVLRAGNALQINVQLIDAETDEHLWAELYDRELTAQNVFAIQREMASAIAEALRATLSPEEVARLNADPTENTRAWTFYLSGLDYQGPRSDNRLAIQQLGRAVEEDPDFALAWAALGEAHNNELREIDRTESRRRLALEAIQRALELTPDLPEAHLAMGNYHVAANRDYQRALLEYAIAEQGMPGDVRIYTQRAHAYARMGDFEQETANWDRVIELDPRNADALLNQAFASSNRRDYTRHERLLDHFLEIVPDDMAAYRSKVRTPIFRDGDVSLAKAAAENPPIDLGEHRSHLGWEAALYERDYDTAIYYLDNWEVDYWYRRSPKSSYYGTTYRLAGQPELAEQYFQAARAEIEAVLEGNPESYISLVALGEALAGLGENEEAVRVVRRAFELMPTETDAFRGPLMRLEATLRVLAVAGDGDATLAVLDEYLSGLGHWSIEGLLPDPRLDPIRDDPRFQVLVDKYRRQ